MKHSVYRQHSLQDLYSISRCSQYFAFIRCLRFVRSIAMVYTHGGQRVLRSLQFAHTRGPPCMLALIAGKDSPHSCAHACACAKAGYLSPTCFTEGLEMTSFHHLLTFGLSLMRSMHPTFANLSKCGMCCRYTIQPTRVKRSADGTPDLRIDQRGRTRFRKGMTGRAC